MLADHLKNNVSQNGTDFRSDELLAKQIGSSRNQIQRYIRLTELIPDLLELVDKKKTAIHRSCRNLLHRRKDSAIGFTNIFETMDSSN